MQRCREITEKLMAHPLNSYFMQPVDPLKDGLTGYDSVIKRKMDLGTIQSNLRANKYASPLEWYQDVVLVYQNALDYHDPLSVWHKIAEYSLRQFRSEAIGLGCATPQEWYALVGATTQKLKASIADGPVPQVVDPLVLSIVKKADTMPPPSSQAIAELVEKVNARIDDESVRFDVLCILRETQPGLKVDGDALSIDADKLSQLALNALALYVRAQ